MSGVDSMMVVVVVRHLGRVRWFRSDRDLWVLDVNKWRDEYVRHGYDVPEFRDSYRFGIHIVNESTASKFLNEMSEYELQRDDLSFELAKRFETAGSWWDVKDLFPILFVDFDQHCVGAFYPDGVPMERYVPDGWKGEFIDFANDYPEHVFPKTEKFWVKGDSDLLKILIERDAKH